MVEKKKRQSLAVELSPRTAQAVRALMDASGMKQKYVVQRVFEWLADQSPETQALVLGQIPPSMRSAYAREMLERLASNEQHIEIEGATPRAESERTPRTRGQR